MVFASKVNQMFLAMHTRRTGSHLHHVRGHTHVREESYYSPYSCRSQAWKMPAEVLAVNVSCDINTTAYVQEVSKRTIKWIYNDSAANLIILTSSLMLTESGTRNLVLSSRGRLFSPWYRSIITLNHTINLPCIRVHIQFSTLTPTIAWNDKSKIYQLTGILSGCWRLICSTSSFLWTTNNYTLGIFNITINRNELRFWNPNPILNLALMPKYY